MSRPSAVLLRTGAGRALRRRRQLTSVAVVGALAGALVVGAAPPAPAGPLGEILVGCSGVSRTSTASDLQTLRQAIITANSNPDADTIRLSTCTYSFMDAYTAGGSQTSWYGAAAMPAIASDITIEGDGSTIQRDPTTNALFRFFFVGADPAAAATLGYFSPGAGS